MGGGALAGGVLAGLAATAVWAIGVWRLRTRKFKRAFGPLAGHYRLTRKFKLEPEPEIAVVTVKGNVLVVRYELPDGGSAGGEILMNEQGRGAGQYRHKTEGGEELWGFWDVQVRDHDTLLVHTKFASPQETEVVQGYRWTRAAHQD